MKVTLPDAGLNVKLLLVNPFPSIFLSVNDGAIALVGGTVACMVTVVLSVTVIVCVGTGLPTSLKTVTVRAIDMTESIANMRAR
jgi:hypothetical protein